MRWLGMVHACLRTGHAPLEVENPPPLLKNPHSWTCLLPPRPFNTFLIPQNREEGIVSAFNYPSPFLGQGIKFLTCFTKSCLILLMWATLDRMTTIRGPWPAGVDDALSPKCNRSDFQCHGSVLLISVLFMWTESYGERIFVYTDFLCSTSCPWDVSVKCSRVHSRAWLCVY